MARNQHRPPLGVGRFGMAAAVAMLATTTAPVFGLEEGTGGVCVPISERAGRQLGCYITATQSLGVLGQAPVFWHIDRYPIRSAAEAMRTPSGMVVESLGEIWLFTIAAAEWRPLGGERIARIGPLPIDADKAYTAEYMEGVFAPGMKSRVHRHAGPEAWYGLSGETCLETPTGAVTARRGETLIIPGGAPMELTATGAETRRALVLVLHDSSMPLGMAAEDWTPKGLCR
jgi:quercetin dioxygenase-like cupin family protein